MNTRPIVPVYVPPLACTSECIFCHPTAGRVDPDFSVPTLETLEWRIEAASTLRGSEGAELAWYGGPLGLDLARWNLLLGHSATLLERRRVEQVRVCARPDQMSPAMVYQLKEAGIRLVELDVPSLSWRVLSNMGSAHAAERVEEAITLLRQARIDFGVQIRPGLPGSDLTQDLETVDQLVTFSPAFLRLYPALVIRGTWLERYHQAGRYVPLTIDETVRTCRALIDRVLEAGIPVARVGLQPMRDLHLEPDCVVGGPYHPSLRSLIEAERMYERAVQALPAQLLPGRHLTLFVAPASESNLRGPENINLHRLRRQYHYASVVVELDAGLERQQVRARVSSVKGPRGQRFAS